MLCLNLNLICFFLNKISKNVFIKGEVELLLQYTKHKTYSNADCKFVYVSIKGTLDTHLETGNNNFIALNLAHY